MLPTPSSSSWSDSENSGMSYHFGSGSSSRKSSVSSTHSAGGGGGSHKSSVSSLSSAHSGGSTAALLPVPQMVTRSQKAKEAFKTAGDWLSSVSVIK